LGKLLKGIRVILFLFLGDGEKASRPAIVLGWWMELEGREEGMASKT
jgi:hypothetical protein